MLRLSPGYTFITFQYPIFEAALTGEYRLLSPQAQIKVFPRPSEHGGYTRPTSRKRGQFDFQACVEHVGPVTSDRTGGRGDAERRHDTGGTAYICLRYSAECASEGVNGLQVERPYTVQFLLMTLDYDDKPAQQEP